MSEIELADHFDRMNVVVSELLKGNNPTQIATVTGFKRAEVVELIDEWKSVVHNDTAARERAKEAISGADQHYAMLIKEAWKTVEDADQAGQLNRDYRGS
jgi:putative N-acetylmannosamine-6-phosphate epimerase